MIVSVIAGLESLDRRGHQRCNALLQAPLRRNQLLGLGRKSYLPKDVPDDITIISNITGADGKPIEQGTVDIRLDAPKLGWFFSTDFPLVEGTRLSEMRLRLRQGRAVWKTLLPIRGEYHLMVNVVTLDGKKASKVFAFKVRENESKWLLLAVFSFGLFLLGFFAGRIFL